jgi:membrane fusion protein (multidrug efflux system)
MQVPGRVVAIEVRTGQHVKAGDVLVRMDARDAAFQAAELEAQLAAAAAERDRLIAQIDKVERQAASQIAGARSRQVAAETTLAAAQSDLEFATTAFDRARALLASGVIAQQRLDIDRAAFLRAQQAFARARAEVEVAKAALLQAEADQREVQVLRRELASLEPKTEALRAQYDRQRLAVSEHEIRAALDGVVDGTFVKPGEYVGAGQRLLLIHNPEDIWVDANVKETDIRHLAVGKPVRVTVDAYPGQAFEGTIARVGHAATSQFALLPNANPSGTFTKVTQRLPVKISLPQRDGLLRPGMMVEVKIDIDN